MDRLVGQSERKVAQALRIVKSCAPCVLLLDEAEKMLGGAQSSNASDSGTLNRVLAEILKFMSSNSSGVFVVMTSNDVTQLPDALTRSGRLDAQWYFALPEEDERKEIFRIHLNKTKKLFDEQVIAEGAKATNYYTGAEISEVVKVALRKAYVRFKTDGIDSITACDIKEAAKDIVPLYRSSKEKLMSLESFANGKARFSNKGPAKQEKENDELLSGLLKEKLNLGGV